MSNSKLAGWIWPTTEMVRDQPQPTPALLASPSMCTGGGQRAELSVPGSSHSPPPLGSLLVGASWDPAAHAVQVDLSASAIRPALHIAGKGTGMGGGMLSSPLDMPDGQLPTLSQLRQAQASKNRQWV